MKQSFKQSLARRLKRRQYDAKYRAKPGFREKYRAYRRAWYERRMGRKIRPKRPAGISVAVWRQALQHGLVLSEMTKLERQRRRRKCCEICGRKPKRALHLDHSHKTGKARGLICQQCNCSLGNVQDSVRILKRMVSYLEKHK